MRDFAPSIFANTISSDIPVPALRICSAIFEFKSLAVMASVSHLNRSAFVGEATLRLNRQIAAKGVQCEHRVGTWHERDVGNRVARNQIPTYYITKGLIESYTVHIDGQSLRCTKQCRSGVAP